MQLCVIKISDHGCDEAVVLNGDIILKADPNCGDSLEAIETVSHNLSNTLNTPIQELTFSPNQDWNWEEVIQSLKAQQVLSYSSTGQTLLVDTTIKDWRLYESDPMQDDIPVSAQGEYALKVEQDKRSGKIWFGCYNKAFDKHGKEIYPSGMHGSIEIRDGLPALSVGIGPDENVLHIQSNTSTELAVIPDYDMPTFLPVEFTEAKHQGYVFQVDDCDTLTEARDVLASATFGSHDFGEKIVVDDSGWEADDNRWRKTVYFDEEGDATSKGEFEILFSEQGTQIIHAHSL